jgi:small conductance mechanosensitive channel
MGEDKLQQYVDLAVHLGVIVGSRILGAIVLWTVGRMIIRAALSFMDRAMKVVSASRLQG